MEVPPTTQTYLSLSPAMVLMHSMPREQFVALRDVLSDYSPELLDLLFSETTAESIAAVAMHSHKLSLKNAQPLARLLAEMAMGRIAPTSAEIRRYLGENIQLDPSELDRLAQDYERRLIQPMMPQFEALRATNKHIEVCTYCEARGSIECDECNSTGSVPGLLFAKTCEKCDGAKVLACPYCQGKGAAWISV
jgi:hypothetical protein